MQTDVVFKLKRQLQIYPSQIELTIRNREEGNVIIKDNRHLFRLPPFEREEEKDLSGEYTIPKEDLNEIIEIIKSGVRLFDRSRFEKPQCFVLDGESDDFFFNDLSGRRESFSEGNFFNEYADMGQDTKAGEVIRICNEIEAVLNRSGLSVVNAEWD